MKRIISVFPILLLITLFGAPSASAQPVDRFEVNRGVKTVYYGQSDTVHYEGKFKSNLRQGRWNWFAYRPDGTKYIYKVINYADGLKEGPFMEMHPDKTIDYGTNNLDRYHGAFERVAYTVNTLGDTIKYNVMKGSYVENTRVGMWQFFEKGRIHEEGNYLAGKKDKVWRTYWTGSPKSKDLMMECAYANDQKHGEETIFFDVVENTKQENWQQYTWYEGVKNGPFSRKDKDAFVVEKGEFVQGKKSGEVMTLDRENKTVLYSHYHDDIQTGPARFEDMDGNVLIKGGFMDGKRNGNWSWHKTNGDLVRETAYKEGLVDGTYKVYHDSGLLKEERKVSMDHPTEITYYDSDGETVIKEYILGKPNAEGWIPVEIMSQDGDVTESMTSVFKPDDAITHETFQAAFDNARFRQHNFYREGTYTKSVGDEVRESGNFTKSKKNGVWDYDRNPAVRWQIVYENGEKKDEKFIDVATKELFKGYYIAKFPNGKEEYNFKVKDGRRHGKCLTYDADGMLLLEEKYKDGKLIE